MQTRLTHLVVSDMEERVFLGPGSPRRRRACVWRRCGVQLQEQSAAGRDRPGAGQAGRRGAGVGVRRSVGNGGGVVGKKEQ
eukprot:1643332-Rhodomonas_salina.2